MQDLDQYICMHLFNHFANITIPYVFKITCMDCDLLQPCITNKENKLNDKKKTGIEENLTIKF